MSKQSSISLFIFSLFLLAALLPRPSEAGEELPGKGPIVITSEMFSADNKANTAVFEGNVAAQTGDMTLHSDRMTVRYSEGGRVEEIEAEGKVRLVKGTRVITSGRAVYEEQERKITFTENPRAVEGDNVITGSKMTYLIEEDRSIVEDSKVFLKQED